MAICIFTFRSGRPAFGLSSTQERTKQGGNKHKQSTDYFQHYLYTVESQEYDTIAEIEEKVEDAKLRRKSVEAEFITMENIYKILQHFGELYDIISDEEKKELIATLVKEIQIYPEEESDTPLKSMKFNFPVYKDGQEVNEIFLDKQTNVETLVYLGK